MSACHPLWLGLEVLAQAVPVGGSEGQSGPLQCHRSLCMPSVALALLSASLRVLVWVGVSLSREAVAL